MPKNRYTAEEIIHRLSEADVLIAEGKTVTATCKQLGVTDQTYYRWRKEYGGMKVDQAKRLKALEEETARLKRAVADLTPLNVTLSDGMRECVDGLARPPFFIFTPTPILLPRSCH